MHCVIASLLPLIVTALSVLLGSISLATWTLAPDTSRSSLILQPPDGIKYLYDLVHISQIESREMFLSTFSYQRSTLWCRNDKSQSYWRLWDTRSSDNVFKIFLKLVTDQAECFEDVGAGPCNCHYPLWAGAICYIDFGTALKQQHRD